MGNAFLIGALLCFVAMLSIIVMNWIDYYKVVTSAPLSGIIGIISLMWSPIILLLLVVGIILKRVNTKKKPTAEA